MNICSPARRKLVHVGSKRNGHTHPSPSFPGRGFKTCGAFNKGIARAEQILTILSSPYTLASSFATSWVPSGLASSTTMISHASSLDSSAAGSRSLPRHALFAEHFGQQPDDDGEVLALVVGRQDDRVLVGVGGAVLALHVQRRCTFKRVH